MNTHKTKKILTKWQKMRLKSYIQKKDYKKIIQADTIINYINTKKHYKTTKQKLT